MRTVYTIGRDPSCCDIVIYDGADIVSRSHATLKIEGRKYYLIDHSTNGTYRNGIKMTPNVPYQISKDDEISFGNVAYLDWSSLPRRPFNWILALLIFIAVLGLAIGAYVLFHDSEDNKMPVVDDLPTMETVTTPVQVDTVTKQNTVTEEKPSQPADKPKPKPQKAKEEKPSIGVKDFGSFKNPEDKQEDAF